MLLVTALAMVTIIIALTMAMIRTTVYTRADHGLQCEPRCRSQTLRVRLLDRGMLRYFLQPGLYFMTSMMAVDDRGCDRGIAISTILL